MGGRNVLILKASVFGALNFPYWYPRISSESLFAGAVTEIAPYGSTVKRYVQDHGDTYIDTYPSYSIGRRVGIFEKILKKFSVHTGILYWI